MKRYPLSTAIAACLLSTSLYAADMNHEMSHENMSMQSSPKAASAPYDHQFIDTMMQHHEMAIQMSQMAAPKVQSPELKDKIDMMIAAQKKESEQLKSLNQQLYGGKPDAVNMKLPGMMSMSDMDMDGLMSAQGKAFDMKFIDMMNKHHQGGISMAQSEINKGKQAEVKALAREIAASQKKDIADLTRMKKEWNQNS